MKRRREAQTNQPHEYLSTLMFTHGMVLVDGELQCTLCTFKDDKDTFVASKSGHQNEVSFSLVESHINSRRHLSSLEQWEGVDDSYILVDINHEPMLLSHSIIYPDTMFGRGTTLFDLTAQVLLPPNEIGALQLFSNHKYLVVELELPASDSRPPSALAPPLFRRVRREMGREYVLRGLPTVKSLKGSEIPTTVPPRTSSIHSSHQDPMPTISKEDLYNSDEEKGWKDEEVTFLVTVPEDNNNNEGPTASTGNEQRVYEGLYLSEAQQRIEGSNMRLNTEASHRSVATH